MRDDVTKYIAERAFGDQLPDFVDGRAVEERVARHKHPLVRLRDLDQVLGLGQCARQRLLHEHVLAGRRAPHASL